MNGKTRCLAAIHGQPTDRVPVFPLLMFFAQDRHGISYREFASHGPALAAAQLRLLERFPLDATTVCSDAFRLCADLGAEMVFPLDKPPHAARPLVTCQADLARLGRPDPTARVSRMADRLLALETLTRAVGETHLVLGWVDMPFAEACNLCGVSEFMLLLVDQPVLAHRILDFLTPLVAEFARAQVAAGAAMVGAGDAAASLISPAQYREFALPGEQAVVAAIHQAGALAKLHICGNTSHLLGDLPRCGADLYNVDHLVPFERAVSAYGQAGRCFKGNLDPVSEILQASPAACAAACAERLRQAVGCRFMLSAGCEIPAGTPDAVFAAFCDAPRAWAAKA